MSLALRTERHKVAPSETPTSQTINDHHQHQRAHWCTFWLAGTRRTAPRGKETNPWIYPHHTQWAHTV